MITSFIRQGYVHAFSCIIADYLLQEMPLMPEVTYASLGYLVNWINNRIYADCQDLKTRHHHTIQAIQHLCSFRAGAYTSDAQKVTQLIDDVISIIMDYANVLPQEAIKRINSRTIEFSVSSPEETEHLCEESWHAFYAIWNDTCQSSGYTLPSTPSDMTDEMISAIAITLKKELEQANYLRPQDIKLDLNEEELWTILAEFVSAASTPHAIGAQKKLLNSAAIILDATFTVYLHHHIEPKIAESIQAVEMLRELYKDNYTP